MDRIFLTASHVWLEGISFQNSSDGRRALQGEGPAFNVVLNRNNFEGYHHTIQLGAGSKEWYIADNVIIGINDPLESDLEAANSGKGIDLNFTGGHVIVHNRISRVGDDISTPIYNCDINNNDIMDISDDGIETDFSLDNIRIWNNRITDFQSGHHEISFQMQSNGPWYIVRNQLIGSGHAFKHRVVDRHLLAHNTIVTWRGTSPHMQRLLTAYSRNNLFIAANDQPVWRAEDGSGPLVHSADLYKPSWKTHLDYDGFDWSDSEIAFEWKNSKGQYPDLESFSADVGIENHGVHVRKEEIFEDYDIPVEKRTVRLQVLTLVPNCAAVDAGESMLNINDGFIGKSPDLGAFELGWTVPHYGPREEP